MAEQKLLPTFECSQKMRLSCDAVLPRPAKWHSHTALHARVHERKKGGGGSLESDKLFAGFSACCAIGINLKAVPKRFGSSLKQLSD